MTNVDGIRTAPERVRPSYHPVLHAHIRLIEDGKAPTCVNLGKELGIPKQAVSQMFQRHPDLRAWISRQVDAAAGHYVGSVLHRHALLGIQGSVESAKLYLAAMGVNGAGPSARRTMAPRIHAM